MIALIRFWWASTRGARLAPWRSPFLQWRIETYTGHPAHTVGRSDLIGLLSAEWRQLVRFGRWVAAIRRLERSR